MPETAVEPNSSEPSKRVNRSTTGFCVSRADHHIQENVILRIGLRPYGNDAYVGRDHLFQVGKQPRPTDSLCDRAAR